MGIFQSRPEEPEEWAGLPAEPWAPPVPGEVLPPAFDDALAWGTTETAATVWTASSTAELTVEIAVETTEDAE